MGEQRRYRLHRGVISMVAFFICVMTGTTALNIYHNYVGTMDAMQKQGLGSARALAEHASRTLGEADRVLLEVNKDVAQKGGFGNWSEKELYRLFLSYMNTAPQIGSIFAIDAQGMLIASTFAFPATSFDFSGTDHFKFQKNNPGKLPFISSPYKRRLDGKWRFSITRPLVGDNGVFQGYVGVALVEQYFDAFYSSLSPFPTQRIALYKTDGSCLAMAPFNEKAFSTNMGNRSLFTLLLPGKPSGFLRTPQAGYDRTDREISYCRVPGAFPVVAVVSHQTKALLSFWLHDAVSDATIAALCLATILVLTVILNKRLQQLEYSEAESNAILTSAQDGYCKTDVAGKILDVNEALGDMLGYSRQELLGMKIDDLVFERQSAGSPSHFESIISEGRGSFESKGRTKTGRIVDLEASATFLPLAPGRLVAFIRDITERKGVEISLRKLYTAVEQSPATIVITDADGLIEYANPKFYRLTEFTTDEVIGQNTRIMKAGTMPQEYYAELWSTIKSGKEWQGEFHNRSKNGRLFWERASISPIRDGSGVITHFVAVKEDITEHKKLHAELEQMAHFDRLTGLPNRALFFDRATKAIDLAKREERLCCILFIDLDGFKKINDTHGHEAGDKVLCETAKRLLATLRLSDTVGRMGGDEFIVILPTVKRSEDAAEVAGKLLTSLAQPLVVGGVDCSVGASIGIGIFPDDAEDLEQLVRAADSAMYEVKRTGKNGYRYFST